MTSSRKGVASSLTSSSSLETGTTLLAPMPSSTTATDLIRLAGCFVVATLIKLLLFPSYYSTDLLVHRHWKAVTRHLPTGEWYWDDRHVNTTHTLDYPPLFAAFESFWSYNPVTQSVLRHQIVDDRCLQLLPDDDNAAHPPSEACVAFLRGTVVMSDVVLWVGAWKLAGAVVTASSVTRGSSRGASHAKQWALFALIVSHPGLLWLDHVHFQYNGMLLGILLWSLSYLLIPPHHRSSTDLLKSAVLFAIMLNLKHLYATLAPWYFFYLLRAYCYDHDNDNHPRFRITRLVRLGALTLVTLLVPWLPLLGSSPEPAKLLLQIFQRLFPFQRGLVHDYWAANVWALAMAAGKVVKAAAPRLPTNALVPLASIDENSVSPAAAAVLLFGLLLVGGWQAWMAAVTRSSARLLLSFVFSALASFQVGYHVHEKAIMTTLIPMLLVLFLPMTRGGDNKYRQRRGVITPSSSSNPYPLLLWEMTAWGLLGLFPLLFESRELALKLTSFAAYLSVLYFVCFEWEPTTTTTTPSPPSRWWIGLHLVGLATTVSVLEVVPLSAWGRYEYAPLALTSVLCASALLGATVRLAYHLLVTLDPDAP